MRNFGPSHHSGSHPEGPPFGAPPFGGPTFWGSTFSGPKNDDCNWNLFWLEKIGLSDTPLLSSGCGRLWPIPFLCCCCVLLVWTLGLPQFGRHREGSTVWCPHTSRPHVSGFGVPPFGALPYRGCVVVCCCVLLCVVVCLCCCAVTVLKKTLFGLAKLGFAKVSRAFGQTWFGQS